MRRIFSFSLLLLWAIWATAGIGSLVRSLFFLHSFYFSVICTFAYTSLSSYTIWNSHFHRVRVCCGYFFFFFFALFISLVKAKLQSGTYRKERKNMARRKKERKKSKRNINCVLTDVPACHSDLMPCSHAIATNFKCFFITLLFYYTFQLAEKILKSDFFLFHNIHRALLFELTYSVCVHFNLVSVFIFFSLPKNIIRPVFFLPIFHLDFIAGVVAVSVVFRCESSLNTYGNIRNIALCKELARKLFTKVNETGWIRFFLYSAQLIILNYFLRGTKATS